MIKWFFSCKQTPAERVKAKMKLQLSETGNLFDAVVQFLLIFLLVFKMVPIIFAFFFLSIAWL